MFFDAKFYLLAIWATSAYAVTVDQQYFDNFSATIARINPTPEYSLQDVRDRFERVNSVAEALSIATISITSFPVPFIYEAMSAQPTDVKLQFVQKIKLLACVSSEELLILAAKESELPVFDYLTSYCQKKISIQTQQALIKITAETENALLLHRLSSIVHVNHLPTVLLSIMEICPGPSFAGLAAKYLVEQRGVRLNDPQTRVYRELVNRHKVRFLQAQQQKELALALLDLRKSMNYA